MEKSFSDLKNKRIRVTCQGFVQNGVNDVILRKIQSASSLGEILRTEQLENIGFRLSAAAGMTSLAVRLPTAL